MAASAQAARPRRRDVRRQLTIGGVALLLLVGLLLAVPGLHPVTDELASMDPAWVLAAIGFEFASCASFVVVYRLFFDRVAPGAARALAWTSMAAGVLLPAGGLGALAVGGWLTRAIGHETGWIIRRSSGLFVMTSAINVATLVAAALLALAGLGGPGDLLRAGLPAIGGCALVALVARAALVHVPPAATPTRRDELLDGIRDAAALLLRPTWRVAGAVGYLWFDVAVMWATLHAIGASPPLTAIVLGYLIGYIANGLPVPGGVGVLDAGLVGAFALYGVNAVDAAAAVLLYHAIALWIPGVGGLLAFVTGQRRLWPSRDAAAG
jgi:uncharacterized membrane protein YbhN (UPF0104 family)